MARRLDTVRGGRGWYRSVQAAQRRGADGETRSGGSRRLPRRRRACPTHPRDHLRYPGPSHRPTPPGGTLWVVEGISTLTAAAAQHAPASVVCHGGTPSVAVTRILQAAANAGWNIAISSDFEPRGRHGAITLLRQVHPAGRPWRLTAAEYLAGPAEGQPFNPSQVPDTPWDPALADAMRHRCKRVSEEARLTRLLDDLYL